MLLPGTNVMSAQMHLIQTTRLSHIIPSEACHVGGHKHLQTFDFLFFLSITHSSKHLQLAPSTKTVSYHGQVHGLLQRGGGSQREREAKEPKEGQCMKYFREQRELKESEEREKARAERQERWNREFERREQAREKRARIMEEVRHFRRERREDREWREHFRICARGGPKYRSSWWH